MNSIHPASNFPFFDHANTPMVFVGNDAQMLFNQPALPFKTKLSEDALNQLIQQQKPASEPSSNSILLNGFLLKPALFTEFGTFFSIEVQKLDGLHVLDDQNFALQQHIDLTQENIMLWRLDEPVKLDQPLEHILMHCFRHLRLLKIVKSISGFLASIPTEKVEGKLATEMFRLGDGAFKQSMIEFFTNGLVLKNKVVPVKSVYHDEEIIFLYNWKGFEHNGYLTDILYSSQNITESEQQRIELESTKQLLSEAEFVGGMGSWIIWPNLDDFWVSDAFYHLLGVDFNSDDAKEQLIKGRFVIGKDRIKLLRAYSNCLNGHCEIDVDFRVKRSDGSIRILHVKGRLSEDTLKKTARVNGVVDDITEFVALQEELKQKVDQFERFAEAAPGGFYIFKVDKDGNQSTPYVNKKAYQIIEQDPADLGFEIENYVAHLHPDEKQNFIDSISEAAQKNKLWQNTHRFRRPDGSYKYIRGISMPEIQSDGSTLFYGIVLDTTHEHQQMYELDLINKKYQLASRTAQLGIWDYRLDTKDIYWDSAIRELYRIGGDPSESLRFPVFERMVHPDDIQDVEEQLELAIQGETDYQVTYRVVFDDGETVYHKSSAVVLRDEHNQPYRMLGVTWDVSQEQTYQQSIENAYLKYQLATRTAKMGIWDLNLDTYDLQWDEELFELFDLPQNEGITYEKWRSKVHPTDIGKLEEQLKEAIIGHKNLDFTLRARGANGRWTYFRTIAQRMPLESLSDNRMLGVCWLVDDSIKRQQKLEESNIKYQLATDTAAMGIWEWDLVNDNVIWDEAMYRFFGMTTDHVITKEIWFSMVHPEDRKELDHNLNQMLGGRGDLNQTMRVKSESGKWIYFKAQARVIPNENGKPERVVGVGLDQTESVLYQQSLEDSNLRYRLATKTRRFGLWEFNPKTQKVFWEDSLYELYGYAKYPAEPLDFNEYLEFIHPEDKEDILAKFNAFIESGVSEFETRFRIIRKDTGETRYLEAVAAAQFDEDYKLQRIIGLNWDITSDKERENELQNILETRDKLFNVIAHDLKGPISNLIGVTDLMARDLEHLSQDEIKNFIRMIQKSSQSASGLLKNLLIWSRNISNRIPFKPEDLEIGEMFEHSVDFFENMASMKKISLNIAPESYLGRLFADRYMIETVIRNLVGNAVKFTPPKGEVTLEAIRKKNSVEIRVRDNGIGMNAHQLKELFKIDGKLHRLGTAKEKGTGLGLVIIKDFVERHKGSIHVESQEGKGSCFTVSIPMP